MTRDDTTDQPTRPSDGGGSVLVTGGTGYVGGLALRALALAPEVEEDWGE